MVDLVLGKAGIRTHVQGLDCEMIVLNFALRIFWHMNLCSICDAQHKMGVWAHELPNGTNARFLFSKEAVYQVSNVNNT